MLRCRVKQQYTIARSLPSTNVSSLYTPSLRMNACIVYTNQKNLISVQPLSTLKDIRLGIDGNVWLKKIISQAASEQYLAGIGGTPSCMRKAIEKELEGFKYVPHSGNKCDLSISHL